MKRALLFCLTLLSGYAAGIWLLLMTLRVFWDQGARNELAFLLFFSGLSYVVIAVPAYIGVRFLLQRRGRTSLFFNILVSIFLGAFAPVLLFKLMYGFGAFSPDDLFAPEIVLFFPFIAGSAIVFCAGVWVTQNLRKVKSFIAACLVILTCAFGLVYSDIEANRNVIHLIPQDFRGTVEITYGAEGYPEIPKENGYYVLHIPPSGVYKTSSGQLNRGTEYYYVDNRGNRITEVFVNSSTTRAGDAGHEIVEEFPVP